MFNDQKPFGDWAAELSRVANVTVAKIGTEQSICFIELYKTSENSGEDIKIGTGTGFLTKIDNLTALVTCWHVVTGLHHETREWLDTSKTCHPNKLKFYFVGQLPGTKRMTFSSQMADLYSQIDGELVPAWNVHPLVGSLYDIAVMKFDNTRLNQNVVPLHLSKNGSHDVLRTTDDVFIIGHPIDNPVQRYMPIYKKGSIASAPAVPYEWHPKFLIDATTRRGMSGSPVILHRDHIHSALKIVGDRDLDNISVVGMYSGRAGAIERERSTELGYVWRIDDVIDVIERGRRDVMPRHGVPIPKPDTSMTGDAIDSEGNFILPNDE